jgi:uncharacterized protein
MIPRLIAHKLRQARQQFPVITLTGPRQSGKTTLVKSEFKDYAYVSLELPDQRNFAREDPRGFLGQFDRPVVLDEVQRVPELLSYIQVAVDEKGEPGQFVLTGSQNLLLLQSISQSLAGRASISHLLPFSLAELLGRPAINPEKLGTDLLTSSKRPDRKLMGVLFTGFYPRIHDKSLEPHNWLSSYYQTYLERDVRNVLQVGDLEAFGRFVHLAAGRNGQLLNLSQLASDCGITHTTARRWISVLESSFLILLLRPYHRNFGKRVIKSPKLYFLDSGLLCFLLRIRNPEDLLQHPARGFVFESFVISELYKNYVHQGEIPPLFFWRDTSGHEIDVLIDRGKSLVPIEIKSAETFTTNFFRELLYWRSLKGQSEAPAALIMGTERSFKRNQIITYPWFVL